MFREVAAVPVAPITSRGNAGFTLVELVFAMLITTVGLLGLLQALSLAGEQNMRNQMRDEVVQVAEQQMSNFMARRFSDISTSASNPYVYPTQQIASKLRGSDKTYTLTRSVNAITNNNPSDTSQTRELIVKVHYKFKNISANHEVHSLRANSN
jgi:Tfp pilus assembly protein PilV